MTLLLLDDRTTSDANDAHLRSIAHDVFLMTKLPRSFGVTCRQIEVLKLRASAYREGYHDYKIRYGGIVVYPRLIAAEHGSPSYCERVPSGVAALDGMFGGGIARGSTTLLTGPTGVGKSTIAMQYVYSAAKRGNRAIVYSFDEGLRTATNRAESLGMKVEAEIDRGTLLMMQVDPAELTPGEFVWQIRRDVDELDTRVVVIDSLNGFMNSTPGERDLILHLHELLA